MSSEIIPPSVRMSRPEGPRANLPAGAPTPEKSRPAGPAAAPAPLPLGPGTASVDDLGLSLGQVSPDPMLGEFTPEPAGPGGEAASPAQHAGATTPHEARSTTPQAQPALDLDVPPSAEMPAVPDSSPGLDAVVAALNLAPASVAAPRHAAGEDELVSTSTADQFAALDLDAPPPSKAEAEPARGNEAAGDGEEDEYEDLPPRRSSWPMALLASYASAVTLGLLWVLWGHRAPRENVGAEADPFPPADTAPDPGHRAGQSRKFVPPPPLPADRIAALGQAVRLGSLEVTPLGVSAGTVILRRAISEYEARRGGDDSLMLKLRLRNLSKDSILVPLDEAFIRERGRGVRDSFIETGPTQQIGMFPLAIVSEWSIFGQEFRELGPGESYETLVVSAPDTAGHLAHEMTWRVRLRTDVNQTETLGVRFREEDIRKTKTTGPVAPELEPQPVAGDQNP